MPIDLHMRWLVAAMAYNAVDSLGLPGTLLGSGGRGPSCSRGTGGARSVAQHTVPVSPPV
jgi:hypothetical protein